MPARISGEEHRDAGADIGRDQAGGFQLQPVVVSDDHGPVRIAQDDLRAHVDELVDKEQPGLEHLLVDEDTALALRGHDEHHRQQVRGQARPGSVGEGHDGPVQERVDLIALLRRHIDVVAPLLQVHAQAAELDGDFALVDGGHADERAHLDHIRQDAVVRAVELLHAVDPQEVGPHSVDERAHPVQHLAQLLQVRLAGGVVDSGRAPREDPVQHLAQLLQVRLAGGVVDSGRAPREDRGHHDIGRTGHGSLVQQHVAAGQTAVGSQMERAAGGVIVHLRAQGDHARQVRVHAPAADLVAARLREPRVPEAAQQRSHDHHPPRTS